MELVRGQMVQGHLGGYVPGGDPNTTYPALWDWLIGTLAVSSVLDVGCGDGSGCLSHFMADDRVSHALGIDGLVAPNLPAGVQVFPHDFTQGPWTDFDGGPLVTGFDLVWCCEFVEHVHEEFVPNYLPAFKAADLVLMTHALPGQGGHHHVNCRSSDYWQGAMAAIGYRLDPDLTATARRLATEETIDPSANYFARTGMAFRRVSV